MIWQKYQKKNNQMINEFFSTDTNFLSDLVDQSTASARTGAQFQRVQRKGKSREVSSSPKSV